MAAKLQLLLVLVFAGLSQTLAGGGFEAGKKYTYKYEARYATGVNDKEARQFAGNGFEALLSIYFDGSHLIFEADEVKMASFNEKIGANIFDKIDLEYKSLDASLPNQALLQDESKKLFYADYNNGEIGATYFQPGHHEVINAKKALVSLFQTNFKQLVHEGNHLYNIFEDSVGGNCSTLYDFAHYPTHDHPEEHVLNVTKIRFYDNCSYRPHLFYSTVSGMKCQSCEVKNFRALKNLARAEYKIRGTKEKYTIERIDATGVVVFAPFSTAGQNIVSVTNASFTLVDISDTPAPALPTGVVKHEHLYYEYNNEHHDQDENHDGHHDHKAANLDDAHFYNRYYEDLEHHHNHDVESYLSHIKSDMEGFDENAKYVGKLIKNLRHFSYDEFVSFFDKNVKPYVHQDGYNADPSSADEQDVRSVLHRVLPLVGTNPSIKFIFELIKAKKMSPVSAAKAISTFAFHVKEPSAKLLEYIQSVELPYHGLEDNLQLALGTLVFRSCVKDDFNAHPAHEETYVDDATCSHAVEAMIEKYQGSSSPSSNTYLRAIVNTRHEKSFKFLASILKDTSKDKFQHRLIAVWGIFNFIETKAEKIAPLFASIFYNRNEDHQIRSYSFEGLLFSKPTPEFFSSLVYVLNKEKNDKVANYIYTTLAAYANTTDPCMEPFKHQIRQTLLFARMRMRDSAQHGANRVFSVYNPQYNYGRTTHFVTIADDHSFVPRDIYLAHSVNVLGYNFAVTEVGTVGSLPDYIIGGIKETLRKSGLTQGDDHESIKTKAHKGSEPESHEDGNFDIYARHGGQFKVSEDITSAIGNLQEVALEIITDQVYMSDVASQVGNEGGTTVNIRANIIKYIEVEYSIPNEMGLPIVFFVKAPATIKMAGVVGAKAADGEGFLALDLKFGAALSLKGGVAVKTVAVGNTGYFVKTNGVLKVPIKGKLHYDRNQRKMDTEYVPSEEPYDIYRYDTTPMTYNKALGEPLPVRYSEEPTNRQYRFGQKYFGAGVVLNFTYDYKWNNYGSYRTFFKSFFKKASSYEDYTQLADKWFAGTRNFLNYIVFNPTGKPFNFNLRFERSATHPTTKIQTLIQRKIDEVPDEKLHKTGQLTVQMKALGPTERTYALAIKKAYSFPYRDHRVMEFHYKRSAIPEYDSKAFEVCFRSNSQIQDYTSIFSGPKAPKKNVKWEYDALLTIGDDCHKGASPNAKSVTIKGLGEKSEEQLSLSKDKIAIYQKCKEDYKRGYEFSYACWKVKLDLGRLDKFTFDVHYKNVPQEVKAHFYRVYGWFRHTFYNNLEIDHSAGNHDPNHVKIVANFSYYDPIVDVHIERENEKVHYHDVFVPSVVPRFEPITVSEAAADRHYRRILKYHRPLCILSGDYVHTLDHVDYKASIGPNYHVAFADFLTEKSAVFVAEDGDKTHKKVKVQLNKHVVEVTNQGSELVVTIDGNKKVISERPVQVPLGTGDDNIVLYRYHRGLSIKSAAHDLFVYTDGKNIKINPSFLLRGHPTGLCGNFDGNSGKEFVNQYGVEFYDVQKFVDEFEVESS